MALRPWLMPNAKWNKKKTKIFIIRRLGRSLFVIFHKTMDQHWPSAYCTLHIAHTFYCGEFLIFLMLVIFLSFSSFVLCLATHSFLFHELIYYQWGQIDQKFFGESFAIGHWALFLNNHTAHWRLFLVNINTKWCTRLFGTRKKCEYERNSKMKANKERAKGDKNNSDNLYR